MMQQYLEVLLLLGSETGDCHVGDLCAMIADFQVSVEPFAIVILPV